MKRKVLFLIESLSGGGAEKALSSLLQNLDYSRFEVTLCCIVNKGKSLSQLPANVGYRHILPDADSLPNWRKILYAISYKLIYNWLPLGWVYSLFVPKHSDAEVAFVEGFATKLMSRSTNKKAKKIAWVHCDMRANHWTASLFKPGTEEKRYARFNDIITVSETARESFCEVFPGISASNVHTILNPVDAARIIRLASEPFSGNMSKNNLRLVAVGRLTPVKAFDRLVRIVSKLRRKAYEVELWIAGEGEERLKLEALIKAMDLEPHVKLLGFQQNPYKYMAHCDLFVCSSLSEGYSTAVTEALILGLPVVTTNCSGMHELLDKGPCGIIAENNEEALHEAIASILDNPGKLAGLAEKAKERSRDFSIDALMEPIETLLMS